jgi:eukaryotic-like serine/threonine-protein kinase
VVAGTSQPRYVDRYELLGVLGSGAFATVYRARHIHTQQLVAVKIVVGGDERALAEARAAAAVQHPNVVRILDCGRSGADVFIVMELAEGPTLAEVIAAGPLDGPRAVAIALRILEGVEAAHLRGIVHRDIKPANVLLVRDDQGVEQPKILDFGVSKQLTEISMTRDGATIGTPGYMAPELFGGAKSADFRSDVYAVAVTLYEMLAGRLPFEARTYEELVVQVATQPHISLRVAAPHVAPVLAAVVERGLARPREMRFASVQEFAIALRSVTTSAETLLSPAWRSDPPRAPRMPSNAPAAYEPTLNVHTTGTLGTAPPPIVSTAQRQESQSRSVGTVAVALIGVLLLVAAGAGLAFWRQRPASEVASSAVAPIVTVADTPSATSATSAATAEMAVATLASATATTTTATTPPQVDSPVARTTGGIKFKFPPKVVGQVRATAVDTLAQHIVPLAQRCRPEHGKGEIVARVRLFVQADGTISIAKAASEPGDEDAAECLAAYFKDAASPRTFSPGGGGIVTVEARLEPR